MEQTTSSSLAASSEMEIEKTWTIPRTAILQSHPQSQVLAHSCSQAESPSKSWGGGLNKNPNYHNLLSGLALWWSKYNLLEDCTVLPQFVLCLPPSKFFLSLNTFSCLILWWQANRIIPTFWRETRGHKGSVKSMTAKTGLSRTEIDLRLALPASPAFLLSLVLLKGLSLELWRQVKMKGRCGSVTQSERGSH